MTGAGEGVTVEPVNEANWRDLEALFERPGPRGGTPMPGSCWCMWWRQRTGDAARNKDGMRAVVRTGIAPGLIASVDGVAAGWVSIAPRESYGQLMRSPTYRPKDDSEGVFVVACFYVDPRHKGRHLADMLLQAAVAHARDCGAAAVECYPNDRGDFMGSRAMFERAAFQAGSPCRKANDHAHRYECRGVPGVTHIHRSMQEGQEHDRQLRRAIHRRQRHGARADRHR